MKNSSILLFPFSNFLVISLIIKQENSRTPKIHCKYFLLFTTKTNMKDYCDKTRPQTVLPRNPPTLRIIVATSSSYESEECNERRKKTTSYPSQPTLISLQLSTCGSDGDTSLGLITHLQDQPDRQSNSKEESQDEPEEEMELNGDIDLVTDLASVLCVVDLGALAVVAVGGHTEDTGSLLAASVGVGLALGFRGEAVSCSWQSALEDISRCSALLLCREQLRALTGVGGHQEDGCGVSLVNLLKLGNEGLQWEQGMIVKSNWQLPG